DADEPVLARRLSGPQAGTPSAADTARMFGKTDLLELFDGR
ncbi:ankyrin repeat domain-containing protein, partial [Streptomyces zhihengii]